MITAERSYNFEFFRKINNKWFIQLLWSENYYAVGQYHTCSNNIRTFLDDCIVRWIYDTKQLPPPKIKPNKQRVELFDKIDDELFKKSVPDRSIRTDMRDLLKITNPPSHSFDDTFAGNPENAANALKTIHRIVSWFYQEFHNGNPLEISNFTLPQSQEDLRREQLIVSKLQNTRTNGHALQKRHNTRQTDTETQDRIMAFLHAAAPIKKEEAIAGLSDNELNNTSTSNPTLGDHNELHERVLATVYLLSADAPVSKVNLIEFLKEFYTPDKIIATADYLAAVQEVLKKIGDGYVPRDKHLCKEAYNNRLPEILRIMSKGQ